MLKGMNEALQYIESNLDQKLDLAEVAKRAYCSEYHFKRLFSLLSGMTISEYIRKRRLTVASIEIRDTDVKVIQTAMKYGYQSPDAFSRAFQNFHGVSPSVARNSEYPLKAHPKMSFQLTIQGGVEMKYRIVEKESFQIVGVKHAVEMDEGELVPSYDEILANINDNQMRTLENLSFTETGYGIVHVTANYKEDADGKAMFDQFIGALTKNEELDNYASLKIPPLLWAIFEVEGDWQAIEDYWQRIYSEWLPSSSYELKEGPEILADKGDKTEIWISVIKKD